MTMTPNRSLGKDEEEKEGYNDDDHKNDDFPLAIFSFLKTLKIAPFCGTGSGEDTPKNDTWHRESFTATE